MEPEIHITVEAGGAMQVEVIGVTGPSCKALSKPYEDLFNISEVKEKPEYAVVSSSAKQIAKPGQ